MPDPSTIINSLGLYKSKKPPKRVALCQELLILLIIDGLLKKTLFHGYFESVNKPESIISLMRSNISSV